MRCELCLRLHIITASDCLDQKKAALGFWNLQLVVEKLQVAYQRSSPVSAGDQHVYHEVGGVVLLWQLPPGHGGRGQHGEHQHLHTHPASVVISVTNRSATSALYRVDFTC